MNSLNTILIEGNLVDNPELVHTQKGTSICKFSIASNRYFKLDDEFQKEVSFFNVTAWARVAEDSIDRLKKGKGIRIVERLKQDRWKGNDGKTKSRVHIIADHIDFRTSFKEDQQAENKKENKTGEYKKAVSF